METLTYSFNAVVPLLLLIALGYFLKRCGKWSGKFFSELNNFCYRVLLPIQLFYNVYGIGKLGELNWRVLGYAIAWIPLSILLGAALAALLIKDSRQKGAFVQASFRSNQAIMGLPLAISLGGAAAAPIASLATSIGIPLFNISAVLILTLYGKSESEGGRLKQILKSLVTNPLIIGVVCGIVCVAIRYLIPEENGVPVFTIQNQLTPIYTAIKNLSAVASPVMLICLGASLNFSFSKELLAKISAGVLMRLVLMPCAAIGGAILLRTQLGLTTAEMPMLVAFFGSPVAVSSVIMVREMGGDEQYAGQLVVWSSVLSMLSLFAIIAVLRSLCFL